MCFGLGSWLCGGPQHSAVVDFPAGWSKTLRINQRVPPPERERCDRMRLHAGDARDTITQP